eukprot:gene9069-1164_t
MSEEGEEPVIIEQLEEEGNEPEEKENKEFSEMLSNPEQTLKDVQDEIKKLKAEIETYLFDVPKLLEKIQDVVEDLLPEQFLQPLATLLRLAKEIPIKKMIKFTENAMKSLEEFEEGVKKGELTVDLDLGGLEIGEELLGDDKLLPALDNFSGIFKKVIKTFLNFIPIELFQVIYELKDKLKVMVLDTYVDAMKQVEPFIEGTKDIMENVIQLLNPIELFTVYFDHLDTNKDGELSLDELLEIGSSMEFFKEQKMEKEEVLDNLMKDASKLVNLVKQFDAKDAVLQVISNLDPSFLTELFEQIKIIIKGFAVDNFKDFIAGIKNVLSFFTNPSNLIGTVMSPQESKLMTHLFESFPMFAELKTTFEELDFKEILDDAKAMFHVFTNADLFTELDFVETLNTGKDAIKSLLTELFKLFHSVKGFIVTAMKRSKDMFQSGEMKDKFVEFIDEDGDGKVEVSDVLSGFSKIGGKLLDKDGDGDFDSKDALGALGDGFGSLLDQDGDGDLDLSDVKKFAVSQLDKDGDGDIDYKDVLNCLKKDNLDEDGDGKIEVSDVMKKFAGIGTALLDQDGDGKLDAKDVVKGAGKFLGGLFKKKKKKKEEKKEE